MKQLPTWMVDLSTFLPITFAAGFVVMAAEKTIGGKLVAKVKNGLDDLGLLEAQRFTQTKSGKNNVYKIFK